MSKRDEDEDERDSDASPEGEGERSGSDDAVSNDDGPEDEAARTALALGDATEGAGELGEAGAGEGQAPEGVVTAPLGAQRYVFSAFFGVGIIASYVLGQLLFTIWANFANRDFFALNLPALAAVPDDSKQTYAMLVGGVIGLGYVFNTYRKPDVRQWADDVAGELVKVKWPSRKEVTSATIVVLTTSAVATIYLFVLDQLWSFVTNLVYGTGS
jgi:preprotein translocase subunit SecE